MASRWRDERPHIAIKPTDARHDHSGVVHWNRPLVPVEAAAMMVSVEDALQQIAGCAAGDDALIIWESAIRTEKLSIEQLRRTGWTTRAATELAAQVTGLSDSGLETILIRGLAHLPYALTPQALIADHRVDLLVGEWVVVQIDGYTFHSTAASRSRDIAHDRELHLRGYTVLRFSYAQVIHHWYDVAGTIARAAAMHAHRRSRGS